MNEFEPNGRVTMLTLNDPSGSAYQWRVFRECNGRGWVLTDHQQYQHFYPGTFVEAAPKIRAIAKDYGLAFKRAA